MKCKQLNCMPLFEKTITTIGLDITETQILSSNCENVKVHECGDIAEGTPIAIKSLVSNTSSGAQLQVNDIVWVVPENICDMSIYYVPNEFDRTQFEDDPLFLQHLLKKEMIRKMLVPMIFLNQFFLLLPTLNTQRVHFT
ncbi:uncharacterized protein LOC106095326 [Stomoxys calcitrans]|uniref:uncharacterized protein LOC106095326 n=1 Tax=Stomoxys calcitrans TaxID=35570 RepID=UPI0027E22F9C|nr:uncharacterized protein LOC106095326 [Stomoxys calcitrans]